MHSRPERREKKERLHELLGAYDLIQRITLYGPDYLEQASAAATLIHERSHSIVANVTTYGTFQKGLALLCQRLDGHSDRNLSRRLCTALDWVLDNAFYADEGYAMSRERDLSALLGNGFDPSSMPSDYEDALERYDRILAHHGAASAGNRLLLVQGLTEAVFNTGIFELVPAGQLFADGLDLARSIPDEQRPDVRLGILDEICRDGAVLARAEETIQNRGRYVVDGGLVSLDAAIAAAFETPGVQSDQSLRLAYLSASMAVFEELHRVRPDVFNVGPEHAIKSNIAYLDELTTLAQQRGLALPKFKGARSAEEERLSEGVLYAPQDRAFDVAWALPSLLGPLAEETNLFFFNSTGRTDTNLPDGSPKIQDLLFLTPFGLRHGASTVEGAYWKVQLMVPIEDTDERHSDSLYRRIVDDIVVMDGNDPLLEELKAIGDERKDSVVAVLPNTDIEIVEGLLAGWKRHGLLVSARLVTCLGPINYFRIELSERPRAILRIPQQVLAAIRRGDPELDKFLPGSAASWEAKHLGWLETTLCHLIEAGAFFGEKQEWHDEFIDDLARAGINPDFVSFDIGPAG